MKKIANTGTVTGIILSFLLMSSIAVKNEFPPGSTREELVFLLIFLGVAGLVFWVSLKSLTKFLPVRLPVLSSTAVVALIAASVLTGLGGFIYSTYIDPQILNASNPVMDEFMQARPYSFISVSSSTLKARPETSIDFAFLIFKDSLIVLGLAALITTASFYLKNKNNQSGLHSSASHELIL